MNSDVNRDEERNEKILLNLELKKHETNHVFHLILSIITLFFWVPIWILVNVSNSAKKKKAIYEYELRTGKINLDEDVEPKENTAAEIIDELGDATVRVVNVIGDSLEKGTKKYNDFKRDGKDKELYENVSGQAKNIMDNIKDKLFGKESKH